MSLTRVQHPAPAAMALVLAKRLEVNLTTRDLCLVASGLTEEDISNPLPISGVGLDQGPSDKITGWLYEFGTSGYGSRDLCYYLNRKIKLYENGWQIINQILDEQFKDDPLLFLSLGTEVLSRLDEIQHLRGA